jgi:hypothetical protein
MTIPLIKVPRFTMTLPLSKETVEYRPFLVKEEKILIMANEEEIYSDIIEAMTDIVRDCTFGKIDAKKCSMFDAQYAFLQIRGKSIGENIEFVLICSNPECGAKTPANLNINQFSLKENEGHSSTIDLGEGTTVVMRYPSFRHYAKLFNDDGVENTYDVVAECVEKIITEEEVYLNDESNFSEMRSWVDNITPEMFEKIEEFFVTMPILGKQLDYTCEHCQTKNSIVVDGIRNFFE